MKINKYFSIVKVDLSKDELDEIYNEYLQIAKESRSKPISYDKFLKAPHLFHYVDMKCMHCDYEERVHYGEYVDEIEEFDMPFPHFFCPQVRSNVFLPN